MNDSKNLKHAFLISIIYFTVSVLWIFLSDAAVASLTNDADTITILQTYKGWFFVSLTAVVLFFLSSKFFQDMHLQCVQSLEQTQACNIAKEIAKASQIELVRYEIILTTLVNSSPNAIFAKDLDGKYILFNDTALKMINLPLKDVLGKSDEMLFSHQDSLKLKEDDKAVIADGKIHTKEEEIVTNDGIRKTFLITKGPLLDKEDKTFGIFGISRDITDQKKYERYLLESKDKFYNLSHMNLVTNLPNRLHISEVLTEKCLENLPFYLILFDLDEFKIVNDSYGHRFGDKLLFEVSKVLKKVFDSTAFIACMGGDEFGIIINSSNKEEIIVLMQKLHDNLNKPFKIDLIDVYITASSGICSYPDDAKSMEELYQAADTAMYNAKKMGKNRFSFYNAEFKKDAIAYTQIVTNLKQAINNSELELYFQSQNNPLTSKIIGAEALLRWKYQDKMIPPDVFIPIAEKSGLIVEIGNFVLKSGFKTVKKWRELGILNSKIAINVSARQLTHLDFINTLKDILEETGCEASWIELEITESSVLENPKLAINLLWQLKGLGFHISMDDFGTGYSSLSYLKNLPIDKLKIDKSFVTNIRNEPKNQIIVKTVIFLARELNIQILAEGVETQDELDFLVENKIDSIQGYYYSKPLPFDEMEKLLQK
ncbi:MAG: EAL domain-containing protein [Sulfurimonas sp.]|uniref:sensor domain-containing protein n=1 Tax=Sulfurimonas sp. TaxID=2022749 RepID=UPI0026039DFA|nr:GGDEF and EAL domain-containing protein [Sulfurimonas sp.]MDD5400569.1 EAL domain-containing protein [Sulfurimonas sp.]